MKRLELRKTRAILGDNREYYEIVAWYPNPDYNKQDEYIPLGGEVYCSKEYPNWMVHGNSCFTMKNLCYTICYWNKSGKLKIVGSRILDEGVDWITLKELLKEGFDKTRKLYLEKNDNEGWSSLDTNFMEKKIGEIFQICNDWFQCCPLDKDKEHCEECIFNSFGNCHSIIGSCFCEYRQDKKNVIFKKLKKIGEPFHMWRNGNYQKVQKYKVYFFPTIRPKEVHIYHIDEKTVAIELEQNKKDIGEIEFGKCEICGKETSLERTYFYYPIHCECCGSKDKDGQKQHFELVHHCKDCPAQIPKEIHPLLKSMNGDLIRANITNILPSGIDGQFVINDKIVEK